MFDTALDMRILSEDGLMVKYFVLQLKTTYQVGGYSIYFESDVPIWCSCPWNGSVRRCVRQIFYRWYDE